MAATEKGVWDLQEVRDKQLAGEWSYTGATNLYVWGQNYSGQLANNTTFAGRSSPIQVGTGADWDKDKIRFGRYFWTGIKTDGTAWVAGTNENGILGQNKTPGFGAGQQYAISSPVQLPGTWSRLPGGYEATTGVKTDGTLWSWGLNENGVLGLNQAHDGRISSPTQIGSGTDWSNSDVYIDLCLAVKTDGTLWSWGNNFYGGGGRNDRTARSSPTQVGTDTTWDADNIAGSAYGASALKTDGTLWAWGYSPTGNLGLNQGNTVPYSSPVQVGTDTTWSKIDTGTNIAIGLKTNGTLWMWGSNSYGALGQNNTTYYSSPVQIPGTTWNDCAAAHKAGAGRKTDGTLWTWGNDDEGMGGRNNKNPTGGRVSSPTQVPGTDWSSIFGSATGLNMMATKTV